MTLIHLLNYGIKKILAPCMSKKSAKRLSQERMPKKMLHNILESWADLSNKGISCIREGPADMVEVETIFSLLK
jgi:hypothetical protein